MIFKSLTFWTLIAGLVAFVAKFFFPAFPMDAAGILAAILFVLGLIGVVPSVRAMGVRGAVAGGIINSLAFWQLVAGLLFFVLRWFAPSFPFDQGIILAFIVFVLGWFGVTPELRARGLK
jgi:hypothetical protein